MQDGLNESETDNKTWTKRRWLNGTYGVVLT